MELFAPQSYLPIYIYTVLILSLWQASTMNGMSFKKIELGKNNQFIISLFIVIFIVIVGLRPLSHEFGDSAWYAMHYSQLPQYFMDEELYSEWVFYGIMHWCGSVLHVDVSVFFLIIEILYVVPVWWACKRLIPNNSSLQMLFVFGAFSFFTYAVNGIRNGMALSLVLLAITFVEGRKKDKLIFILLCYLAYNTHHSSAVPIAALVFTYFYRKPKAMFYFWGFSILISLGVGDSISNIFIALGLDDRGYLTGVTLDEGAKFTRTGFRWDFLLYSAMPILLGWYAIFKRNICDSTYILLLGTYIYANAFWVIVIRAPFSNRFAYLSWFLYPIVLAYPLLKLPIFKQRQGQKTAMILVAHFGFTFLMWLIGKL